MAPLILFLLRRYPQCISTSYTEGRIVDIVAAGFDLGLRPADLVPADMIAVPLGLRRSNAVVASPEFPAAHGVPAGSGRSPPLSLHPRPSAQQCAVSLEIREGRRGPPDRRAGAITLDESSLVRIAAQSGIGIGYVMEGGCARDIAAGRLVRVLEDWTPSWRRWRSIIGQEKPAGRLHPPSFRQRVFANP